jgi:hypothetical protein
MNSHNKYLINKYFLICFTKHFTILKSSDFKKVIFKITLIETVIPNGPNNYPTISKN